MEVAMSEVQSTTSAKPSKPAKPRPDFPLFPHAAGVWAKKIRGKIHYFGPWDDPDAALDKYLKERDALHAGRRPREDSGGLAIKDLANRFLNAKALSRDAGEITARMWQQYKHACDLLVTHFGKGRLVQDIDPEDFATLRDRMSKRWGFQMLGGTIQRVRTVFKFAFDNGLVDRPVRYGQSFKRPSKKTMRLDRAKKGAKLFAAEDIRKLLDAAGPAMRAMIYLGINCGFGNSDCANLPQSAVDLDGTMIDFPRPKTGIPRRCPLWPETVEALREALARRPQHKNDADAGLFFITKYGLSWGKETSDNPVSKELAKLLRKLGINGRKGLGFYTLRHIFRTIADEAKDQPAADHIMGHESSHMSTVYRERISDGRLRAVVDHVRAWLFGEAKEGGKP
jgi:integrase